MAFHFFKDTDGLLKNDAAEMLACLDYDLYDKRSELYRTIVALTYRAGNAAKEALSQTADPQTEELISRLEILSPYAHSFASRRADYFATGVLRFRAREQESDGCVASRVETSLYTA